MSIGARAVADRARTGESQPVLPAPGVSTQATAASDAAPLESRATTSMQVRALTGVTVALVCLVSWTGSS